MKKLGKEQFLPGFFVDGFPLPWRLFGGGCPWRRQLGGWGSRFCFLGLQVIEDLPDHHRFFVAGNDLQRRLALLWKRLRSLRSRLVAQV